MRLPSLAALPLALTAAFAQPQPAFEVASVKPAVHLPPGAGTPRRSADGFSAGPGPCPTSLKLDPAQVNIRCATLAMLIGYAYRFPPDRIQGPAWLQTPLSPRFDIVAKIPAGAARSQIPEMLQSLLAERFHLVLHSASATRPVLALVVAKEGIQMKAVETSAPPTASDTDPDAPPTLGFFGATQEETSTFQSGPNTLTVITGPRIGSVRQIETPALDQRWESTAISLSGLADLLDKVVPISLPIVDQTGASGRYQLLLEISMKAYMHPGAVEPGEAEATVLGAFNDALRKLGVQLQRRTASLPTLFIDRLDQAPTAN